MFYFFTNAIYCVIQMCLLRDVHRSLEMLESHFLILFCNFENLDRKLSSPVGTNIETTEGET